VRNAVNPGFAHHQATASSIWGPLDLISVRACTLSVRCLPGTVLQGGKLRAEPAPAPSTQHSPPGPAGIGAGSALAVLEQITSHCLE